MTRFTLGFRLRQFSFIYEVCVTFFFKGANIHQNTIFLLLYVVNQNNDTFLVRICVL